ncbi:putative UVR domain, armadillo-like helical protein [Plasmopara halstedii]
MRFDRKQRPGFTKQTEEQLKSIGLQLARLEAKKREAVANEDYDLAKKVKHEISMLEASVTSNETQPILPMPIVAPSPMRSEMQPTISAGQRMVSSFAPRDMYVDEQQHVVKSRGISINESGVLHHSTQSDYANHEQDEVGGTNEAEDSGGGGFNPHFRGIPDAEELPDPDDIPPALAKECEEMIAVIGSFLTRCIYSNLWNHRDAAIRKVTMEIEHYSVEPMRLLEVCSTLVQSGAGDRISQVILSAFELLNRMLTIGARIRRDDMCRIVTWQQHDSANEQAWRFSRKGSQRSCSFTRTSCGSRQHWSRFCRLPSYKALQEATWIKVSSRELLVLKKLLTEFELVSNSDFSVSGIMGFLEDCNCLAHQSREIRDVAKEITVSMYLIVGSEVEVYLKSLRPKQLNEFQAAFEAAETANASMPSAVVRDDRSSGSIADGTRSKIL